MFPLHVVRSLQACVHVTADIIDQLSPTMDELSKQFYGSFAVAEDPNDPARPHPRFSQYKLKQEGYGDQDARRKRMLEEQKDRRRDAIDFIRKIAEDQLREDDEMEEEGRKKQRMRNYDML